MTLIYARDLFFERRRREVTTRRLGAEEMLAKTRPVFPPSFWQVFSPNFPNFGQTLVKLLPNFRANFCRAGELEAPLEGPKRDLAKGELLQLGGSLAEPPKAMNWRLLGPLLASRSPAP